jgi:sugar O-acyltransferase (sialic acid O-acetyltransferase NeuD family)
MNLILYGDSNYAELVKYYFESDSKYKVVAFCVDSAYKTKDRLCGLPVVPFEEIEDLYSPTTHHLFAAIGYKSMRTRQALYEKANKTAFTLASYISTQAIVDKSNKIGQNCMILPGAILEPFASIDSNCFINTGSTICHHSQVKSHCFFAARSMIGGYCEVGENSFLGFNSTVIQQRVLANETLVATNSLIMQDTQKSTMYAGSPARAIRSHSDRGIEIV